jgi:uncharacterized protein (TIGR03083 family)
MARTQVEMLDDVAAERRDLADLLDTLTDEQWATPSLCPGWTVRDVAAHLTFSTCQPMASTILRTLRARGDMDRVFAEMARERARTSSPEELVARLRAMAGVDRRFRLAGRLDPLNDLLVHGQDIAIPLGCPRAVPVGRAVPCLAHAWRNPIQKPARRFAGLRFVATDADAAVGDGPTEVRGPVGALLLVVNGRAAGLADLHGPGASEAAGRMAAARA